MSATSLKERRPKREFFFLIEPSLKEKRPKREIFFLMKPISYAIDGDKPKFPRKRSKGRSS